MYLYHAAAVAFLTPIKFPTIHPITSCVIFCPSPDYEFSPTKEITVHTPLHAACCITCVSLALSLFSSQLTVARCRPLTGRSPVLLREKAPSVVAMRRQRSRLPAWESQAEIVAAVRDSRIVVIAGETGCGKTTQVSRLTTDTPYLLCCVGGLDASRDATPPPPPPPLAPSCISETFFSSLTQLEGRKEGGGTRRDC
jgi:hypothetical protein